MGRVYKTYLESAQYYCCKGCQTHIVSADDLVSKDFTGRYGRAYLFDNVMNIVLGPTEQRQLLTGLHEVADFQCVCCSAVLGWKYAVAQEPAQKYKEGKYIIELALVNKVRQNVD
eukprot:TRINITY_DN5816_c0_g1_i2.p2 TRINITY_DN5816_c0_g1~~TRINITY_DN5816_c0_g1_i2.p2  ORF type:complete len:115 (+),score=26.22 TRINITY_DN5816_c0_g1_i2:65-409(+)